jgi:hypothetical protein
MRRSRECSDYMYVVAHLERIPRASLRVVERRPRGAGEGAESERARAARTVYSLPRVRG